MQKISKKRIKLIIDEIKQRGFAIIPNAITKKDCDIFCSQLNNDYKKYSKFYNLLYKDKNYQQEVDYVDKLMNENGKKIKSILDLGFKKTEFLFSPFKSC